MLPQSFFGVCKGRLSLYSLIIHSLSSQFAFVHVFTKVGSGEVYLSHTSSELDSDEEEDDEDDGEEEEEVEENANERPERVRYSDKNLRNA